jgi:hypothetical protein
MNDIIYPNIWVHLDYGRQNLRSHILIIISNILTLFNDSLEGIKCEIYPNIKEDSQNILIKTSKFISFIGILIHHFTIKLLSIMGINEQIRLSLLYSMFISTPLLNLIASFSAIEIYKLLPTLSPEFITYYILKLILFYLIFIKHVFNIYLFLLFLMLNIFNDEFDIIFQYCAGEIIKGGLLFILLIIFQWYNNRLVISTKINDYPQSIWRCIVITAICELAVAEPKIWLLLPITILRSLFVWIVGLLAYNSNSIIIILKEIKSRGNKQAILVGLIELIAKRYGNPKILLPNETSKKGIYYTIKSIALDYLFNLIDIDFKTITKQQLSMLHFFIQSLKHNHQFTTTFNEFKEKFFTSDTSNLQNQLKKIIDDIFHIRSFDEIKILNHFNSNKKFLIIESIQNVEIFMCGINFNKRTLKRKEYLIVLIDLFVIPYIILTKKYWKAIPPTGLDLDIDYSFDPEPNLSQQQCEDEYINDLFSIITNFYFGKSNNFFCSCVSTMLLYRSKVINFFVEQESTTIVSQDTKSTIQKEYFPQSSVPPFEQTHSNLSSVSPFELKSKPQKQGYKKLFTLQKLLF